MGSLLDWMAMWVLLNRNEAAVQAFAERGASVAQNPREVAEASDVVITMLPSSPHVRTSHLYLGLHQIFGAVLDRLGAHVHFDLDRLRRFTRGVMGY
jgi:3-hydroxyisobutyrate dehydrogenase-like beta-hydroxyacid dehydrogenase